MLAVNGQPELRPSCSAISISSIDRRVTAIIPPGRAALTAELVHTIGKPGS
jgi:hypothetical protein